VKTVPIIADYSWYSLLIQWLRPEETHNEHEDYSDSSGVNCPQKYYRECEGANSISIFC